MIEPLYSVAVQLKTLMADGMATRKLRSENTTPAYIDWPRDKHVVSPHQEPQRRDADDGQRHNAIAEDRLAREAGDDLADHAHAGRIMMYTAGCE